VCRGRLCKAWHARQDDLALSNNGFLVYGWSDKYLRVAVLLFSIGLLCGAFLLYGGWMMVAMIVAVILVILEELSPLFGFFVYVALLAVLVLATFLLWYQVRRRVPERLRVASMIAIVALPLAGAATAPVLQELRLRIELRLVLPPVPEQRVIEWRGRKLHLDSSFGPHIEARLTAPTDRHHLLANYARGFAGKPGWHTCYRPETEPVPTCWKKGIRKIRVSDIAESDGKVYWNVRYETY